MFAATILVLSLATFAAAQGAPVQDKKAGPEGASSISIKVTNLACTTAQGSGTFSATAYSFGATLDSSSTSGGGGGAGKATIMPLNATKLFDECSPALFGAVVTGKRFPSVDLTQTDSKGNAILTINLTDAVINSYQIGGSQTNDSPQESIQIDFRKICISQPSTGNKFCFDRGTNSAL